MLHESEKPAPLLAYSTLRDLSRVQEKESDSLEIFDAANIDTLQWPNDDDGDYAKRFLTPLIKQGISTFIDNIQADIFALKVNSFVFPVVVPHANSRNAYVCSLLNYYFSYGREVVGTVTAPLTTHLFKAGMAMAKMLGRLGGMDEVVFVNNWLFSTDLYPPELNEKHLKSIARFLSERFPGKAILFRSLNSVTTPELMTSFSQAGYQLLANRQVYICDARNEAIFKTRILKSDLKLLRESSYEILDEKQLSLKDCSDLLDLHLKLYVADHSDLNPQVNLNLLRLLFEKRLLKFKALKKDGCFKGMAGFYQRNGVMHCPLLGYDKADPDHTPIYRLLNTALLLEAKENQVIFHQSAGASFYKTIRRATSCLEFTALYTHHISFRQKCLWATMCRFINAIGPYYMKKY